jgi:hypothetical protein
MKALGLTFAPHRDGGGMTVKIKCFGCDAGLDEIHVATGIPKTRLLKWPPPDELGPPVTRSFSPDDDPEPMPSEGTIAGASSRLRSSFWWDWLVEERGLTPKTIKQAELGLVERYGREMLMFPLGWRAPRVPNPLRRGAVFRALDGRKPKYTVLRGMRHSFYPALPKGGAVLLVAGMFDPLVALQHPAPGGKPLPVTTTTGGATLPHHLVPDLVCRQVAVAYDVGEEIGAERTVAKLREVGTEAWVVHLEKLGLRQKGDVADLYRCGGTTVALLELIKSEKRAAL